MFLFYNQYIIKTENEYKFNVVWIDKADFDEKEKEIIPDLSNEYKPIVSKLYEGLLEIEMRNQPEHIRPQIDYMVKGNATGGILIPYILKYLIDNNKLKKPLPEQKKTITTLMANIR